MARNKDKQKITVEALLRLKRHERPDGKFWDTFEHDFQRRRLNALVERPAWSGFFGPGFRALAFGLPALALVAFSVFWNRVETVRPSPLAVSENLQETNLLGEPARQLTPVSRDEVMHMDTSLASNQFVVDAIEDDPRSINFRKVLYTPAIRLSSQSGTSYVRDSFSSSSYKVTTADVKLGRNF